MDQSVRQLYTSEERHLNFLVADAFLKLTNATVTCSASNQKIIKLAAQTKIYSGKVFDFECDAYKEFMNSPVVGVSDALKKSPYERFSVTGVVVKVSPIKEGSRSRRREVELEDLKDKKKKLCVNLWRQSSESEDIEVDTSVVVKNVYCKMYNNTLNFNSTQHTKLEVVDTDQRVTLTFDGFNVGDDGFLYLDTEENTEYKVDPALLLERLELDTIADLQGILPVTIDVTYRSLDRTIKHFDAE
ncbi:uncharacterized protein [Asterias amurensis]|uniref:uncharacterized protein n=1 Tax=Asterias amurensis TaxID=7602 RepID=UPI003AB868B6